MENSALYKTEKCHWKNSISKIQELYFPCRPNQNLAIHRFYRATNCILPSNSVEWKHYLLFTLLVIYKGAKKGSPLLLIIM